MNTMHTDIDTVRRLVFDTFSALCADPSTVTDDAEVMHFVDSVGLIIALADLQSALDIELDPNEIIGIFQCGTLGEVAGALFCARQARAS